MDTTNLYVQVEVLTKTLQAINYDQLPISNYNKEYINRLKPALEYYMHIFASCISKILLQTGKNPCELSLIDYGGGHGFLSMLANKIGFKQVIYIDINPLSVQTVTYLKELTKTGPDIILSGGSDKLKNYCESTGLKPQALIATDLIEHVYNLDTFFADLICINNEMSMIFTTASTPFNPFVKKRLHRMMDGCENGSLEMPNFYTKRLQYIRKNYPEVNEKELNEWALNTRGLIYDDIQKAMTKGECPTPYDSYNTCDPETGNWTERILPITDYRQLLKKHQYEINVCKGFYNVKRSNVIASMVSRSLNLFIRLSGKAGLCLAPFIILYCKPNR